LGNNEDRYACALGIASWWLATAFRDGEREDDSERGYKMQRVCDKKLAAIRERWPVATGGLRRGDMPSAEKMLSDIDLDRDTKRTLLIDLLFSDPFAPYELKFSQKDLRDSLKRLAEHLGLPSRTVDEVADIRKDATKAHRNLSIGRIVAFGLGGVLVLGLGGWMAAPLIAGYLGAGAGLAGAAATAHGLALLGGGTIAAGGMGMAGGMIVITGVGAVAGGVGGTGGALLFQMGAAAAENELIKLQVTYKAVLLNNQSQTKKAQEVVKGLAQRESEVRSLLTEERQLNESNARKVKELEDILESIEDSREWIKNQ
jgi:hypothetical protein